MFVYFLIQIGSFQFYLLYILDISYLKYPINNINEFSITYIMNNIDILFKKLPYELINIIFQYDGRIKYKYKQKNTIDYHRFVNVIHKHDKRYSTITPIIDKKMKIMKNTTTSPVNTSFYFEFAFDNYPNLVLCYDYNWSYDNVFEICYTDMTNSAHVFGSDQIRTIYN